MGRDSLREGPWPVEVGAGISDGPEGEGLEGSFRAAMRRHAAGVCILSAGAGDDVNGMAITAAVSFSLDPPSVLVCVNAQASVSSRLRAEAPFTLTVLGAGQQAVAAAFSRRPSGRARFDTGAWILPADGPPRLEGAAANLLCRVAGELAFGSHRALVGRVEAVRLGPDGGSLLYRDGEYF